MLQLKRETNNMFFSYLNFRIWSFMKCVFFMFFSHDPWTTEAVRMRRWNNIWWVWKLISMPRGCFNELVDGLSRIVVGFFFGIRSPSFHVVYTSLYASFIDIRSLSFILESLTVYLILNNTIFVKLLQSICLKVIGGLQKLCVISPMAWSKSTDHHMSNKNFRISRITNGKHPNQDCIIALHKESCTYMYLYMYIRAHILIHIFIFPCFVARGIQLLIPHDGRWWRPSLL